MASTKRQSWADAPRVFISLPACPKCAGDDLKAVRSYANGDGSTTRRTICRSCGCRFFVVAEPSPEFGQTAEGEC